MKLNWTELTRKLNAMLNPSPGMRRAMFIGLVILIIGVVVVLLGGCAQGDRIKNAPNGCVPRAIGYLDALAADEKFKGYRKSRIVVIEWGTKTLTGAAGHAFCAFVYSGRVMAYDDQQGGTWTMSRDLDIIDKANGLAALWCGTKYAFKNAYFLDDE